MAEQMRTVIAERRRSWLGEPDLPVIYHLLAADDGDADFQPVVCGGGIVFNGGTEKVPESDVCPDCLTGTVTLEPQPARRRRK